MRFQKLKLSGRPTVAFANKRKALKFAKTQKRKGFGVALRSNRGVYFVSRTHKRR